MGLAVCEDLEREKVRKTRPRVVLTPEISIDDVDKDVLQVVLEDKYKSTVQNDYRTYPDAAGSSVVSPLVPRPAPAQPIKLEKFVPRVVPAEWRMDSVGWDGRQLRAYCDPTMKFWTSRRPVDHP